MNINAKSLEIKYSNKNIYQRERERERKMSRDIIPFRQ